MITVGWHEAGDGERAGEGGVGDFEVTKRREMAVAPLEIDSGGKRQVQEEIQWGQLWTSSG